jgi:hypothetical protein
VGQSTSQDASEKGPHSYFADLAFELF